MSSCGRTLVIRTSPFARISARRTYNSLQVQLNRRYIHGLQFAVAYTLAKTISFGPNSDPPSYNTLRPGDAWNEAPYESTQLHNLIVNYTWDVPNGSRMWNNLLTRGPA